jgi:tetratricopeptide (TPR) repeat protein
MIISEDVISNLTFADRLRLYVTASLLKKLIQYFPGDPGVLARLGNVELLLGDYASADERYSRSLKFSPDQPETLYCRGFALERLGKALDALQCHARALVLRPGFSEAIDRKAKLEHRLWHGSDEDGTRNGEHSARDEAERLIDSGMTLFASRCFDDALACFNRAIDLAPNIATAHNNRGSALYQVGRIDEALASFDKAISYNKRYSAPHRNKGIVLAKRGELDASDMCFDRALQIEPFDTGSLFNRAVNLLARRKIDEAIGFLERALSFQPDHIDANLKKAYCKLLKGELDEGFRLYEWRLRSPLVTLPDRCVDPSALLSLPVRDATLLIFSEQNPADILQFCRFIPLLKEHFGRIIVETQAQLLPLLRTVDETIEFIEQGEPLPDYDVACPIASLPLAFKTTLETIPATTPYLHADPVKSRQMQQRLGTRTGLRVGLAWSEFPPQNRSDARTADKHGDIPLHKLAPFNLPGVEFFSLHIGDEGAAQLQEVLQAGGPGISDLADALGDFSDIAALIDNLDLVIATDSTIAHLAGAMAKPVWILNRFDSDWRWMLNRTDTPWYPTVRLFPQHSSDDWESVVDSVTRALRDLLSSMNHEDQQHAASAP